MTTQAQRTALLKALQSNRLLHLRHERITARLGADAKTNDAAIAKACRGLKWDAARTLLVPLMAQTYHCEVHISQSPVSMGKATITDEAARKQLGRILTKVLKLTPPKTRQHKAEPMPDVMVAQMVRIASRCTKAQWNEVVKSLAFKK